MRNLYISMYTHTYTNVVGHREHKITLDDWMDDDDDDDVDKGHNAKAVCETRAVLKWQITATRLRERFKLNNVRCVRIFCRCVLRSSVSMG